MYLKYLYLYIYLYYKCRSSTVTLSVSLNRLSVHLSAFVDIFIRYKSRHPTLELSVMGTEMVSTTAFFHGRKLFLRNEISIDFRNLCSKPTLWILNKFVKVFFSCRPVWSRWYNLHPVLACFIVFTCLYFDLLVNPASNTSQNSRVKY